jgi:hypothetical protein
MQHLEGSGMPVLYIGRTVLKGLWNLNFFRQIFEKYAYIKYHENPFSGTEFHAGEQMDTDGHEANSGVSLFWERA